MDASTQKNKKYRTFFVMAGLFCLLRLTTLLTSIESTIWWEELHRGTIAKELLTGLKVPFFDYQADSYDGGSLAVGLLAAAFFKLMGIHLFALKMVPFTFSLGAFTAAFFFLNRFFSRRAAVIACLLLAFCPPVLAKHSLAAIGSHTESIFFSLLMFYFFYRFAYEIPHRKIFLAAFAFVSGLGCWFTSMTGITLLALVLVRAALVDKPFTKREVIVFCGGFLTGVLPWFIYNVTHHFSGYLYIATHLQSSAGVLAEASRSPLEAVRFVGRALRSMAPSLCFPDAAGVSGKYVSFLYFLLLLAPCVFLLRVQMKTLGAARFLSGLRRSKMFPVGFFMALFLLVYAFTDYNIGIDFSRRWISYRYFTPLFYFTLLFTAIALSRMPRLPVLLLAGILSVGAFGQRSLVFNEPFARGFSYRGISYFQLGFVWGQIVFRSYKDLGTAAEKTEGMELKERRELFRGIIEGMDARFYSKDMQETLEAFDNLPFQIRLFYLYNYAFRLADQPETGFEELRALLNKTSVKERPYIERGFAKGLAMQCTSDLSRLDTCMAPPPWLANLVVGYAAEWLFQTDIYPYFIQKYWDQMSHLQKIKFARGAGRAMAWDFYAKEYYSPAYKAFPKNIPEGFREEAFYGLGWRLKRLMPLNAPRAYDKIADLFPSEESQKTVLRGYEDAALFYKYKQQPSRV
jgi:hypothetical protein